MCWAGLINGEIILHWFELGTSVNQHVYKDMLQTVAWPRVKNVATHRQYWFQQDGATAHTTNIVLAFLQFILICNCLSKCVDGVLQDLNVVCRSSSEFFCWAGLINGALV